MTTFVKRTLTAVIGLPLVIYLVIVGGWALSVVIGAFALVALREFYIAFAGRDKPVHLIGYFFTLVFFVIVYIQGEINFLLLVPFVLTVKVVMVVFYSKLKVQDCISTIYGFMYVPFLLAFFLLMRQHEMGQYFVWLIFTAAFGCDTFAYLTGVTIGRRKLKNSPSPSKSVEGLIGGILGAGLVGFLFGFIMEQFFYFDINFVLITTVVSLIGAVFSIIGDMAASAIKRFCEIKDFGNVIPGHGGVLDRIDSILVVAPVVYLIMIVVI